MIPTVQEVKIKEEDEIRKILESHPAVKDLKNYFDKENNQQNDFVQERYIDELKEGVEITEKTYPALFALIFEIFDQFNISPNLRVIKQSVGDGENAFMLSDGKNALMTFQDNILNLMDIEDQNEIKSVVGHEIGHFLYDHNSYLLENYLCLIGDHIYREKPLSRDEVDFLKKKNSMEAIQIACVLSQICELNADRIGLLACSDFDATVLSSIKLSAGAVDKFGKYDVASYIEQAENLIKQKDLFTDHDMLMDHPYEPLRAKALQYFYTSDVYSKYENKTEYKCKLDDFSNLLHFIVPIPKRIETISEPYQNKTQTDKSTVSFSNFKPAQSNYDKDLFLYIATWNVIGADNKITKKEEEFVTYLIRDENNYKKAMSLHDNASREEWDKEYSRVCEIVSKYDSRTKTGIIRTLIKAAKADRKVTQDEINEIARISGEIDAIAQCKLQFKNTFGIDPNDSKLWQLAEND